jgi:hypothetical protein
MYYEINVALNGKHFFATDKRSCTNQSDATTVLTTMLEKFPQSEGYSISCSYCPEVSWRTNVYADIDDPKEVIRALGKH